MLSKKNRLKKNTKKDDLLIHPSIYINKKERE